MIKVLTLTGSRAFEERKSREKITRPTSNMVSEGTLQEAKELVITQASIGGFDESVTAEKLTEILERRCGLIWRCRLKTSWTPPESYPNFEVSDTSNRRLKNDYDKVKPHAFVHFASPEAAKRAYDAAGRTDLLLNGCPLKVDLGLESSFRVKRRINSDPWKFSNSSVEVGTLVGQNEFLGGWKGPEKGVDFLLDPFDGTCNMLFTQDTVFSFKNTRDFAVIKCNFKIQFFARVITGLKLYTDGAPYVMLIQLMSSPFVYYRTADDDIIDSVPYNLLDDEDPWIRTTDFTPNGVIGRCSTYKISFSPRLGGKLQKAMAFLKLRKVFEEPIKWRPISRDEPPEFNNFLSDFFHCVPDKVGISFDVLFLLNALLQKGLINQFQINEEFFLLLKSNSIELNKAALKHMWSYKRPIVNAYNKLKRVQEWLLNNPRLIKTSQVTDHYVEVRRVIVTPTRAYCLPPEVELSNRVLRNYKTVADRFLRVTFLDEDMEQLNNHVLQNYVAPIVKAITSRTFPQKTNIYRRVHRILSEGFHLSDRKYSFLAFSSNQLRGRSAWFFAENEDTNVKSITAWMGKFSNKNIAKCAARMGQCFSSTYATVNVLYEKVNYNFLDIERNGHVFSDGIGKMTPDLATEVAEKLQLTLNPPCAYQIRYAGCKGVIACWPGKNDGYHLSLRPSMVKFSSMHTTLEVVSWARFQPGFLNRQIVTLLSALKVPDHVFLSMQDTMVYKLNQVLDNPDVAFEVVTTSCSEQGNTAAIMLSAGFKPQTEPYLRGMLSCIRSSQVRDLLEKARIFVPSGRWLLGCLDELGVLEYGQCFIQISTPSLENRFSKHGLKFSAPKRNVKVIVGTVVIAKNPCLHPGDIRILEAVDDPSLHHLVDCLVFPQNGDRPHTNEASGSDLDGDQYFVTWDDNLIPPGKVSWPPMDYTPADEKKLPRAVVHKDLIDFFMKTMVTENLGRICNAHVVHADLSDDGALDEKCLKLAELASQAVDFPKTGNIVNMPPFLKPKMYPDFMDKEESRSYKSMKVLGRLYRKAKDISSDGNVSNESLVAPEDIKYDMDLDIPGSADYILNAGSIKCSYDGALNALLEQYSVKTEEEIVTGHFWSMPKYNSRKQSDMKEKLKNAYISLQKEFRAIFEAVEPFNNQLTEDEKNAIYEQKASAWYQVTYHPKWVKKIIELREPEEHAIPVRLSFAWIAADYLVRIKVRAHRTERKNSLKPIDCLATYLLDKI